MNEEHKQMEHYVKEIIREKKEFINISVTIKKSSIHDAGFGIFTDEDIPINTYFIPYIKDSNMNVRDILFNINDLAYNGSYNLQKVDKQTNVQCVIYLDELSDIFISTGQQSDMFKNLYCLKSIKQMSKGYELSRTYGLLYWKDYEIWKENPDSKYRETHLDIDLPNEYVFICKMFTERYLDKHLNYQPQFKLYGKKINNKYYYKNEYDRDLSNDDNSELKEDVSIYNYLESDYVYFRQEYIDKVQKKFDSDKIGTLVNNFNFDKRKKDFILNNLEENIIYFKENLTYDDVFILLQNNDNLNVVKYILNNYIFESEKLMKIIKNIGTSKKKNY